MMDFYIEDMLVAECRGDMLPAHSVVRVDLTPTITLRIESVQHYSGEAVIRISACGPEGAALLVQPELSNSLFVGALGSITEHNLRHRKDTRHD